VFRLAGTRICDLFGRELKGERFLSLWDARSHTELRMLLGLTVDHAQGFVAGVLADVDDGQPTHLELLLLPLSRADTTEARSIGTLAAFEPGRHLQLQTVSGLRLEGWRYVGSEAETSLVPRQMAMPPDAQVQHGLIVLPGGRS
jgi:hypothetical protein